MTAFTAENISFGWKYTKQKVAKKNIKSITFFGINDYCVVQSESRLRVLSILFHVVGHGPPLAPSHNGVKLFLESHLFFFIGIYICDFTRFFLNFPFLKPLKFRKFSKDIKTAMLLQNGFIPILFHPIGVHISRRTSFLVYLAVGPLLLACLFPSFLFLWYFRDRISGTVSSFNLKSSFWGLASPPPATP